MYEEVDEEEYHKRTHSIVDKVDDEEDENYHNYLSDSSSEDNHIEPDSRPVERREESDGGALELRKRKHGQTTGKNTAGYTTNQQTLPQCFRSGEAAPKRKRVEQTIPGFIPERDALDETPNEGDSLEANGIVQVGADPVEPEYDVSHRQSSIKNLLFTQRSLGQQQRSTTVRGISRISRPGFLHVHAPASITEHSTIEQRLHDLQEELHKLKQEKGLSQVGTEKTEDQNASHHEPLQPDVFFNNDDLIGDAPSQTDEQAHESKHSEISGTVASVLEEGEPVCMTPPKSASKKTTLAFVPEEFEMNGLSLIDDGVEEAVLTEGRAVAGISTCSDGGIPFYMLDAHDDVQSNKLYLFGKIWNAGSRDVEMQNMKRHPESCCVVVEDMQRCLYFVPKRQFKIDYLKRQVEHLLQTLGQDGDSAGKQDNSWLHCGASEEELDAVRQCLDADSDVDAVLETLVKMVKRSIMSEMVDDIRAVRERYALKKITMKSVKRHYFFDKAAVQRGHDQMFVKVTYSAQRPAIDASELLATTLKNSRIAHVFGCRSTLTELLIIERRIMGPCWLKLINVREQAQRRGLSWCRRELFISDHKDIRQWSDVIEKEEDSGRLVGRRGGSTQEEPPRPPLTIMCIGLRTVLNKSQANEICFATMLYTQDCNIDDPSDPAHKHIRISSFIRKIQADWYWPAEFERWAERQGGLVTLCNNEQSLLAGLCSVVQEVDPDVLVGHNIYAFDLEVLAARFHSLKLPFFHKLSRLRSARLAYAGHSFSGNLLNNRMGTGMNLGRQLTFGRLVCDTYIQARDLLRNKVNYRLATLVADHLGAKDPLIAITPEKVPPMYASARGLCYVIMNMKETLFYTLQLTHHLQMLLLTRELTNLAGNLWYTSLQSKRADRNDWLLMHEFHNARHIYPDKEQKGAKHSTVEDVGNDGTAHDEEDESGNKRKAAYAGGLVLEPKAGLYDTFVLVLDFNSLYPSIIQEFNVCFTTVDRPNELGDKDFTVTDVSPSPGILPRILKNLVEKRRSVKQRIKVADQGSSDMLRVREMALKLTANSLYGTIGFVHSRFHARPIASYITRQGRQLLTRTKAKIENELRFDVVYGDTDSIMINTGLPDDESGHNYSEAKKKAIEVKTAINKAYQKIEIDLDATFKRLLLLKKKKYACVKVIDYSNKIFEHEMKGIDIVRRDWCGLTKKLGHQVLDIMFSERPLETVIENIHSVLSKTAKDLASNTIEPELFVITKALTKMPEQYSDGKTQPHVKVAKRQALAGQAVKAGNEIPYIICSTDSIVEYCQANPQEFSKWMSTQKIEASEVEGKLWSHFSDRAFSTEEVAQLSLRPDVEWYKAQQLHPPLNRLCVHLGTGGQSERIAESLGLDRTKYKKHETNEQSTEDQVEDALGAVLAALCINRADKFKNIPLPPYTCCHRCSKSVDAAVALQTFRCATCNSWLSISDLKNYVYVVLWQLFLEFSKMYHVCGRCDVRTNRFVLGTDSRRCPQSNCQKGDALEPKLPPRRIYQYLDYLKLLLDKSLSEEVGCMVRVAVHKNGFIQVLEQETEVPDALMSFKKVWSVFVENEGPADACIEMRDYAQERRDLQQLVRKYFERCGYAQIPITPFLNFGERWKSANPRMPYPRFPHLC